MRSGSHPPGRCLPEAFNFVPRAPSCARSRTLIVDAEEMTKEIRSRRTFAIISHPYKLVADKSR